MNAYFPEAMFTIAAISFALLVVLLVVRQFERVGHELDEDNK